MKIREAAADLSEGRGGEQPAGGWRPRASRPGARGSADPRAGAAATRREAEARRLWPSTAPVVRRIQAGTIEFSRTGDHTALEQVFAAASLDEILKAMPASEALRAREAWELTWDAIRAALSRQEILSRDTASRAASKW